MIVTWAMASKANQNQAIAREQLNLEKWMNVERMRLNFEKHQPTQLDKEEE